MQRCSISFHITPCKVEFWNFPHCRKTYCYDKRVRRQSKSSTSDRVVTSIKEVCIQNFLSLTNLFQLPGFFMRTWLSGVHMMHTGLVILLDICAGPTCVVFCFVCLFVCCCLFVFFSESVFMLRFFICSLYVHSKSLLPIARSHFR